MSESLTAAPNAVGQTDNISFESQYQEIKSLVNQGLNFDAMNQAEDFWGNWQSWSKHQQLDLLCTMLEHLGMERHSKKIRLARWRNYLAKYTSQQDKPQSNASKNIQLVVEDHDIVINYGYYLLNYRSPLLVWELVKQFRDIPKSDEQQAEWFCLEALTHSQMRDFSTAHTLIQKAKELLPDDQRIERTRVYLLSNEDKPQQALSLAESLYQDDPRLSLLGKKAKLLAVNSNSLAAIEWLKTEIERFQSIPSMLTLAHYYDGINDHLNCQLWLDRITHFYQQTTKFSADKDIRKWITQLQASTYLASFDYHKALAEFEQLDDYYSVVISDNIRQGLDQLSTDISDNNDKHTLTLDVPHMVQKHLTCAPTTLVAISRFHGFDFDEDEVAAKICYGGTSNRNQNQWLSENQFIFRSFDLTWALAVTLLDKGLPFTLVTGERMSSHLQAVIGYNQLTGTLLLMDPSCSCPVNMLAAQAIEKYAYLGPRCTVFVPEDKAYLLADIEFIDEPLYRLRDQFEQACDQYQYAEAGQLVEQMIGYNPEHRICIEAQKQFAIINENEPQIYAHNAKLLEAYPDDVALHITAFVSQSNLGNRAEAIAELSARVLKYHEPDLMMMLFNQIRDIASEQVFAEFLRSKIRRYCWTDAEALWVQAHQFWDRQQFDIATDYYRFALCCGETTEKYVESYFKAAKATGKTEQAMTLLNQRFDEYGHKSSSPCISLYCALELLDQEHQGIAVLEKGVELRPDDGYLLYYYLNKLLFCGLIEQFAQVKAQKFDQLEDDLQRQLEVTWLRHQGEIEQAIEQQLILHKHKPLSYSRAQSLFELQKLAQCQNDIDVRLLELLQQYGQHRAVIWLNAVWHGDSQVRLTNWQKLTDLFGYDLNNYESYIDALLTEHQSAQALTMTKELLEKAQDKTYYQGLLARVLLSCGDWQGAKEAAKQAIIYNADDESSQDHLLNASLGLSEKTQACEFIAEQILAQNTNGLGISNFWLHGQQWLSKAQLKSYSDAMLDKFNHCWQAWLVSAKCDKLNDGIEQAIEKIQLAISKFPLSARLLVELAELYQHQQQIDLAIEQLSKVSEMFPSWNFPAKQLSILYENQGEFISALSVLSKAVRHNTEDGSIVGMLADMQYRTGDKQQAIESLKLAIKRQMAYPWAWSSLANWSQELGECDHALELAQQLCEKMPHLPICWLNLARVTQETQQKLTLLNKALTLNETSEDIHIALIDCYIAMQQFEKAEQQIDAKVWQQQPPLAIQLKRAEILRLQVQLGQACQYLNQIVEKHPNCKTAWSMLANCYRNFGKQPQAIEAINKLVEIDPYDCDSLSIAGQTIVDIIDNKTGREQIEQDGQNPQTLFAQAREYLASAFLLSPSVSEYGLVYLDLLLMDLLDDQHEDEVPNITESITEKISETITLMEQFQQCVYLLVRKIQFDCYTNHGDESLPWWRKIVESKEDSSWIYINGANALQNTKYKDVMMACLDDAIRHGECAKAAVVVWVRQLLLDEQNQKITEFIEQQPDSPFNETICKEYISLMYANPEGFKRQDFEPIEDLIAANIENCGRYGYLLSLAESRNASIQWFEKYQMSKEMPAFVLYQHYWTLQDVEQYQQSSDVLEMALAAEPDGSFENLALLRTNEKFIAGESISREDLVDINYQGLSMPEQYIFVLLLAVIESQGHTNFKAMLKATEPMLRDAQMLNQQVTDINLCIRTRRFVRNWLKQQYPASNWFHGLMMRFSLSHYF